MARSLPIALRRAVLERDGHACSRPLCSRADLLAVHHVVAVDDGGTDDAANLVTLCGACHREWHTLERRSAWPFDRWLAAPPLPHLLALFDELAGEWAAWAAELELERPEQLRRTKRAMEAAGRRLGAPQLGATPAEAAAVERARQLRAAGLSFRAIGEQLAAEGHEPRTAAVWHAKVVRTMVS